MSLRNLFFYHGGPKNEKMTIRKMFERTVVATNKREVKNIFLVSTDGEIVKAEFAVDLIQKLAKWNFLREVNVISAKFYDDYSLCDNVLEPYLSKTFIYGNYASQKGKGTHFGLDRLKYFMSRYYRQNGADGWVLKCDIRKYFYSINHDVLKEQLRRLIKDRDVLWLLDMIINSTV